MEKEMETDKRQHRFLIFILKCVILNAVLTGRLWGFGA